MSEQQTHGYGSRRAAVRNYWLARALSLSGFLVGGYLTWRLAGPMLSSYVWWQWLMLAVLLVPTFVVISATPFYDMLGLLVAWTGRVPQSCPFCLATHAPRLRVAHDVCEGCGAEEWQVRASKRLGGWTYHFPSGTSDSFAYCSKCRGVSGND